MGNIFWICYKELCLSLSLMFTNLVVIISPIFVWNASQGLDININIMLWYISSSPWLWHVCMTITIRCILHFSKVSHMTWKRTSSWIRARPFPGNYRLWFHIYLNYFNSRITNCTIIDCGLSCLIPLRYMQDAGCSVLEHLLHFFLFWSAFGTQKPFLLCII